MAKRLFILSGISDKESEDIITLLNDNYINFYITPPGGWMQSMETIWVKDHAQFQLAQEILSKYFHAQNINITENNKLLNNANRSIINRIFSNPTLYAFYIPTFIIVALMVFLLT